MTVEIVDTIDDTVDKQKDDDDLEDYNAYQRALLSLQKNVGETYKENSANIKFGIIIVIFLLYFAYFGYAMYYRYNSSCKSVHKSHARISSHTMQI